MSIKTNDDELIEINIDNLDSLVGDIIENIEDDERISILRQFGIYVHVEFELDKTLWNIYGYDEKCETYLSEEQIIDLNDYLNCGIENEEKMKDIFYEK